MRNDVCPNCGGNYVGDGYTDVYRCENAAYDDYRYAEPDAQPILCPEIPEEIKDAT